MPLTDRDGHLKRVACQIFTQLPEDKRDAMLVLGYVKQIVFCLGEEWETVSRTAPILPFPTDPKDRGARQAALREVPNDHRDKASQE